MHMFQQVPLVTGGDGVQGTPAHAATRKLLPPTPSTASRLVAASLSSLPNALDAQFWISRANHLLAEGKLQVALHSPRLNPYLAKFGQLLVLQGADPDGTGARLRNSHHCHKGHAVHRRQAWT